MPIPTTIGDLSLTQAANSPAGSEAVGNQLDDYLRAQASLIRTMRAIGSVQLTAAATTSIATSDGEYVTVNGSTNITSLGAAYAGCLRQLAFSGSPLLQHSAALFLPGAVNFQVQPNDVLTFRAYGTDQWALVAASRATVSGYAALASPALTGTPTINGIAAGYRGIPLTTQNATYSLVAGDAGKGLTKTDTSAYTYTVPAVFAAGDIITIDNSGSAGAITLTGSGVTLILSGSTTTGNRTVAPGGVATVFFTSTTTAKVGGTGVA